MHKLTVFKVQKKYQEFVLDLVIISNNFKNRWNSER